MQNDAMTAAYIEAIYFTDTGDSGQPDADAELSEMESTFHNLTRRKLAMIFG